MSQERRLAARATDHEAPGWFTRAELPRELREGAAQRLGVLGLITACTFFAFFLMNTALHMSSGGSPCLTEITASSSALLLSLGVFLLWRLRPGATGLLLQVGAAYQLLMAALIGLLNHSTPWDSVVEHQGWSGIAIWILLFAVFVPSPPRRTLWLSLSAAALDPLTLLVMVGLGQPMPAARMLPLMFGPTLIMAATAVIAARVGFRLGRRLSDAQEMGSYMLVELLGKGGMGEVWRAEHKLLARPAAIKLIRPEALTDAEGAAADDLVLRFEREAQATARLRSAHTIELYDFGVSTDGTFYYVMELLEGLDLELLVERHGPVGPARAVQILRQICESLAEAHERGLIHRDIKPSNIYLCQQGLKYDVVKVLDFGLVKSQPGSWPDGQPGLTADGSIRGTPAYMVPEIIEGAVAVDGRADLYAVGCVAYWLLAGTLVFEAKTPMKMVVSHSSEAPAPLSSRAPQPIPPALEALVQACLEKDPAGRPQSAVELDERLAAMELDDAWDQRGARRWWRKHVARSAAAEASVPNAAVADTEIDPMGETLASE